MTRVTTDPGDAAFPDGERLHEAFAEEVDRPGLEGPAFELVLRSGTARLRRRRAGFGATFAVAGAAAVATATLATGGASHTATSAAAATTGAGTGTGTTTAGTTSTGTSTGTGTAVIVPGATGTTPTAPARTPATTTTAEPPTHPDDAVLTSGTIDGHHWQLVRTFTLDQPVSVPGSPAGTSKPQWCGSLNVIVDGVWTNAGSGGTPCLDQNGEPAGSADPADPGYTTIAILDARHDRLGTVATGSISSQIKSVTARCGAQSIMGTPSQPAGDANAYYAFTFADGTSCQAGSLSFFDASGSRTAFLSDLFLSGGK